MALEARLGITASKEKEEPLGIDRRMPAQSGSSPVVLRMCRAAAFPARRASASVAYERAATRPGAALAMRRAVSVVAIRVFVTLISKLSLRELPKGRSGFEGGGRDVQRPSIIASPNRIALSVLERLVVSSKAT